MKTGFDLGKAVRFVFKDGRRSEPGKLITAPRNVRITGAPANPGFEPYVGEGFYYVATPDGRKVIAHEDDLELAEEDNE